MQPMFTQTPPSLSRSTTAVLRPSWAARMAQTYPAGPPPITITSKLLATYSSQVGRVGSPDESQRILQHALQGPEELRARRAVDHAVIARHGEPHPLPWDD